MKKGFTLVELLVVIVLMVSIMGFSVFGIQKINEETKLKNLRRIKTQVELSAGVYFANYSIYEQELLNDPTKEKCTRLYVLESKGLIDIDLVNPYDGKRIPGNLCIMSKVNDKGIVEHHFEYIDNLIEEHEEK